MEISQISLAWLYFYALLLGFFAGFLYDLLRITRVFFGVHYSRRAAKRIRELHLPLLTQRKRRKESHALGVVVFLEDLIFCLLVGVSLILLFYAANNGKIRFSALLVSGAGFLLYRGTLGRLMMVFSEVIAFCVETAVRYAVFFLLYPIRKLFGWIRKKTIAVGIRTKRVYQKQTRRRFTEKERVRLSRNACGMIPEGVNKQRSPKRGKQIVKRNKKAIQSDVADARASRRAGGGLHRDLRQ